MLYVPLALWLIALALPIGADAATVITGIVRTQSGQPLSGLALLENGEIHNNPGTAGRWSIRAADFGSSSPKAASTGCTCTRAGTSTSRMP